MIVKRVEGRNIVTYPEIDFEFPEAGVIGIQGKNLDNPIMDTNAVGKTLLFDMISYAPWGEILRKKRANILGEFDEKYWLKVTFEDEKYGVFSIERSGKPAFENVAINIRGKTLKNKPRKIQPTIDRIFGMGWLTFQNCILYGDSRETNFVFVADNKRKEIMLEIAGALDIREARKLVGPDLKERELRHAALEGKIEALWNALESAKNKLQRALGREREVEQEKARKIAEIDALIDKKKGLIEATWSRKDLDKKISACENMINEEKKKLHDIEAAFSSFDEKYMFDAFEETKKKHAKKEGAYEKYQNNLKSIKEKKKCPFLPVQCPMNEDTEKQIGKELAQAFRDLSNLREELKSYQERVDEFNRIKKILQETREALAEARNRMNKWVIEKKKLDGVEAEIKALEKEKAGLESLKSEISTALEEAQEEYEKAMTDLSKGFFKSKSVEIQRNVLKYWSEKYSQRGVETLFVAPLVKKLNAFSKQYILRLTDGSILVEVYQNEGKGDIQIDVT
jgi:DNA repair exonuclease SbcCD ATPase subunit